MLTIGSLDTVREGSAAKAVIDQGTAGPQLHDRQHAQYKLGTILHE